MENVIRGNGIVGYDFGAGIRIDGGFPIVRLNNIQGNDTNGILMVGVRPGGSVRFEQIPSWGIADSQFVWKIGV